MAHQIPVLASRARFKLLVCGRRWAKTSSGQMAITRGHGQGRFPGAVHGGVYWWVAPSYKQIQNSRVWEHLKKACRGVVNSDDDIREVDREIRFPSGATISVRSADGDMRGAGLSGVVIDEAAFMPGHIWSENIRPALADKQGWAMLLTTPNGKNWIHKLFTEAHGKPDWECWQRPTSDNPLITAEELELIRNGPNSSPRVFAQEYLAQFTEIEGALFPSVYFDDPLWCDDATDWPAGFELSAIAIDPSIGRESKPGDFSAIVFAGLSGGKFYVEADLRRRPPMEIVADTIAMYRRLMPCVVSIEANAFQAVMAPLFDLVCERSGIPPLPLMLVDNHEAKAVRIQRLDPHLAGHKFRFRRSAGTERLIEQLQMFPDRGFHDDGPDALEMALRALNVFWAGQQDSTGFEIDYAAV